MLCQGCVRRPGGNDRISVTKHDAPLAILAAIDGSHAKGEVLKFGSPTEHRLTSLDLVTPGDIAGNEVGSHVER